MSLNAVGVSFRLNVREGRVELSKNGGNWAPVDEHQMQWLRFKIADTCRAGEGRLLYGKENLYALRDALVHNKRVDPFEVYLNELPELEIVEKDVDNYQLGCDRFLENLFGVEPNDYYRHAARALFLGAVYRTFKPGYKLDEMIILQGPQGAGKDSVLREMLPHEDFFTENLCFSSSNKDKIEVCTGKVIVCASELNGFQRSDTLETIKGWVTRQVDRTRLAYRRDAEDISRRFIVVGTTNSSTPVPNDPTGSRRWIVVQIPKGAHVEPFMEKHRERFWQEAIALYKMGIKPNLSREMKAQQEELNEEKRERDDQYEDAFDMVDESVWAKPIQSSWVAFHLNIVETPLHWAKAPKQAVHRLRSLMENRGFEHRMIRIDGKPSKHWIKKGTSHE